MVLDEFTCRAADQCKGPRTIPVKKRGLLSSARRATFLLAELSGLGRHLKREVVWVDGDDVCHGKRTRSRCQATGAAAPVPMAASASAEAELQEERPRGAAGGARWG